MAAEAQDALKANVVLVGIGLLNTPDEVNSFSGAVGAEVILAGAGLVVSIPPGPPESGRKLELHRDRISLDLTSSRAVIERGYPMQDDLSRLAEVAGCAMAHTDLKGNVPTAFGYNMELVYEQTSGLSSLHYLGERLFGKSKFNSLEWTLAGGAGRLVFDSAVGRWTMQVEPRFNDGETTRVFLNANLHKAEQRLPDTEEIHQSLRGLWEKVHGFIEQLDEGE